ncbi:MAG TPA: hypothetical protein VK797_25285 [Tepidisphaeraceae bacterium]|jgi:hypothetical protein|nr:hypothetical protein [Tepidisphaeraceae bacterium]
MRRETRVNLIFLAVFLAISLPGAVILVRKKLQPGAPRMDQPDVIVTRLPYMTPLPQPPGVKWIVPDQMRAWLEEVIRERTGKAGMLSAAPPGPQWEPVISQDHLIQVMAASKESASTRLSLLIWTGQIDASIARYAVTIDGAPARVIGVHEIPVPENVRRELVRLDYVRPPTRVIWLDAESAQSSNDPTSANVTLSYTGPPAPLHTSLEFGVK